MGNFATPKKLLVDFEVPKNLPVTFFGSEKKYDAGNLTKVSD